ncbi:MAG TPA: hypothetical protein VKK79_09405 [Candidatus Lokiarchaeia archaeon]|nr:hypothetical protein [Candidatus Lokiarchaeia archaeon]
MSYITDEDPSLPESGNEFLLIPRAVIEGGVLIKAISIISEDGLCFFHQDFGTTDLVRQNPQLLGGFFSAIISWAQVNSGQALRSMKLDEDVILIENDKGLYFILQFKPEKLDIEGAKLILYQILEKFTATFPDAGKIVDSAEFDPFYDVVPQMILQILQQTVEVFCPACGTTHAIVLDRNSIADAVQFPVKYTYLHGDSQVMLSLYLDSNFQIIKTEVVDLFEMNENQLEVILSDGEEAAQMITPNEIYGFLLSRNGVTRTHYLNLQYETEFDLQGLKEIWKLGSKLARDQTPMDIFYMKQAKFWVAGVRKEDFELILVTAPNVTTEQLDSQLAYLFDHITTSFE